MENKKNIYLLYRMVKGKKKPMNKKQKKMMNKQKGGFIAPLIAGATAAHQIAQKYKPVSMLDEVLQKTGLKSEGKSTLGKIVNKAIDIGKSFGYGQSGGMSMPPMIPSAGRNQVSMAGSGKMRMIKVI